MEENEGHRLVHLDLKGAPPRLSYYEEFLPLVREFGATGLLVEYEDAFPYSGDLRHLQAPAAYTPQEVARLQALAEQCGLAFIPLVQTFGHFEFVLKHDEERWLREVEAYPNALCPTHPQALPFVTSLLSQVIQAHPNIQFFHIGADEVWHMGRCQRCQDEMTSRSMTQHDLFLAWVALVAGWVRANHPHLTIIMWDDMLRPVDDHKLLESGLGELVEPMVWQYHAKKLELPPGLWSKYGRVFGGVWAASAFKGATGSTQFLPPIQHHINNQLAWVGALAQHQHELPRFRGICLTGWQRYDHYAVLCELLPVAVPCLCLCLQVLTRRAFTEEDHDRVSNKLGFGHRINVVPFPRPQMIEAGEAGGMQFPGHKIYVAVQMWSNFVAKYHSICNSEGMLGWFSDYLRSRNFTNPVQVEGVMAPLQEVQQNLVELRAHLRPWLLEVFHEDTVTEWLGSFLDPLTKRLAEVLSQCREQIAVGGRVRDYDRKEV